MQHMYGIDIVGREVGHPGGERKKPRKCEYVATKEMDVVNLWVFKINIYEIFRQRWR